MIKKSIASILIILIWINSIGCYSYNQIKIENTEEIERADKVKITTLDGTVYYLTDVEVQESMIRGKGTVIRNHIEYLGPIFEIRIEDIKKIEAGESDVVTPIVIVLSVVLIPLMVVFLLSISKT